MVRAAEGTRIVGSIGACTLFDARSAAPCAKRLDAVEIRLDALTEPGEFGALRTLFEGKILVATLRSTAEGGAFRGESSATRSVYVEALAAGFDLVDVEYRSGENADLLGFPASKVILSVHDLEGLPADLSGLAARMAATGARFVKIVGTANDSSDALRLLEAQAALAGRNATLIAMGEAGMATRVLSPYLGAPLAYGSLVRGRSTAAGQIAAEDLAEIYGMGRRRPVSRLFALLAGRVSHSLSPALHNANFEELGEDALYVPFMMRSLARELPTLREGLSRLGLPLRGASVTVPLKEEAAEISGEGEPVNTLLFGTGESIRTANTDRAALEELIPSAKKGERALVLGAGGTGRVAVGVLLRKKYEVFLSSRTEQKGREVAALLGVSFLSRSLSSVSPRVLVNATPLGLSAEDPLPCDASLLKPGLLVVDAPYREGETALVRAARAGGAEVIDGFALLLAQAAGQATLFTGRPATPAGLANRLPDRLRGLFTSTTSLPGGVVP